MKENTMDAYGSKRRIRVDIVEASTMEDLIDEVFREDREDDMEEEEIKDTMGEEDNPPVSTMVR
jgi:hypothetical protein